MANTNVGISNFVYSQSPFFVKNDHPAFIKFVEAYYEYLEQDGKTIERAKSYREALDIDKTIDIYSEQLYSQFLHLIPRDIVADKAMILKHAKDFYRAKGTEKSVQFLLSILYDLDSTFYYPKKDILKASDGKWYLEKSLKVYDIFVNDSLDDETFTAKNFTGRQIRGLTSNATATVESVDVYYENGVIVKELKVSNQIRDFNAGEKIVASFEEEGEVKSIKANVFSGIVVRADIINRGNNYVVGDKAIIESNTGSGAEIVVSSVSSAAITSVSPIDGGAGFQNTNIILFSGGKGVGANAYVSLVNTDETYHPNTYNIVATTIGDEANTIIGNTMPKYETFAYPNLNVVLISVPANTSNLIANAVSGILGSVDNIMFSRAISDSNVYLKSGDRINLYNTYTSTSYVLTITSSSQNSNSVVITPKIIPGNTVFERVIVIPAPFSAWSNLTISSGAGTTVQTINLSSWKSNSNTFFETYDNIYTCGINVMITKSNTITNQLVVTPGIPGGMSGEPFQVFKKPNVNTTLANSVNFFKFANTGPIQRIVVLNGGSNYVGDTTITAQANTRVKNLGILGRMKIVRPGSGYVVNDEIEFINQPYAKIGAGSGARGYVASVNATGAITSVKFKEVAGHIIGGSGYNMLQLPTANVITSTGEGGNVIVSAILGDGEKLTSTSDDIGAILSIKILSGGSGYKTPPTINLKSNGSGTAQIVSTIVQGVFTYPGRYLNDDGHLSSFNFLQDGKYYHNYSYVIQIKKAIDTYRKALKDLVHPAGMSAFGEYTTVDNGETMNIQLRTANTTGKITFNVASYMANLGNIKIIRTNHNIVSGNTIYLEFQSGDTINIANGIFKANVGNSNVFFTSLANSTTNTSGNVYYGILR